MLLMWMSQNYTYAVVQMEMICSRNQDSIIILLFLPTQMIHMESHTIKYSQKYSEIFESKCHHLIAMKLDLMLSQYLLCISILMTCEPLFYFKHIALYKLRFNVKDSNTHIFAIKSFLSSSSPVYFLPQRCSVYIIQAIMLHIYICSFYYMYCSMYCIFS